MAPSLNIPQASKPLVVLSMFLTRYTGTLGKVFFNHFSIFVQSSDSNCLISSTNLIRCSSLSGACSAAWLNSSASVCEIGVVVIASATSTAFLVVGLEVGLNWSSVVDVGSCSFTFSLIRAIKESLGTPNISTNLSRKSCFFLSIA